MTASRVQRNSAGRGSGGSREQTLPLWAVGEIMKKVLPAKARISEEAKERVQDYSSKFAAVIIERAIHECQDDGSSEIDGGHIILALSHLGFDEYVGPLMNHLRQDWNIDETEAEPEQEMGTRPTPEYRLRRFHDGGDYPNGILAVGTAESFQHVPALILSKIY